MKKTSGFLKGYIPWNKGLTKESDKRVANGIYVRTEDIKDKIRLALLGTKKSLESKEKMRSTLKKKMESGWKPTIAGWWKGKKHTEEHNLKISEAQIGKKRRSGYHWSEEAKKKLSEKLKGKKGTRNGVIVSEETREKMRIAHNNLLKDPEYLRKILCSRRPTSLEKQFQEIVDKNNLPYKYVGDGKFFIERFNPDFINTNNEKIAIEVYARYYKLRNGESIEKWKEERNKIFKKYGWKIVYFNEIELVEQNVLNKL